MSDAEAHYSVVADTILAPLRASDPSRATWPIEMKLLDMACKDARYWWERHRDRLDDLPKAAMRAAKTLEEWKGASPDMIEEVSAVILTPPNEQGAEVAAEEQARRPSSAEASPTPSLAAGEQK